jgi:hypothetical protein
MRVSVQTAWILGGCHKYVQIAKSPTPFSNKFSQDCNRWKYGTWTSEGILSSLRIWFYHNTWSSLHRPIPNKLKTWCETGDVTGFQQCSARSHHRRSNNLIGRNMGTGFLWGFFFRCLCFFQAFCTAENTTNLQEAAQYFSRRNMLSSQPIVGKVTKTACAIILGLIMVHVRCV